LKKWYKINNQADCVPKLEIVFWDNVGKEKFTIGKIYFDQYVASYRFGEDLSGKNRKMKTFGNNMSSLGEDKNGLMCKLVQRWSYGILKDDNSKYQWLILKL
jgi:hypothetical protein